MTTTKTTTTDAEGKITTVIHEYEKDLQDDWAWLTLHLQHLEAVARAAAYAAISYFLVHATIFIRHMFGG